MKYAVGSTITLEQARDLAKTMYALTYTKPGHVKPSKVMLRMNNLQSELYRMVCQCVAADLGNA